MNTYGEVAEWRANAIGNLQDLLTGEQPVCQLFFRWINGLILSCQYQQQSDLICGLSTDGEIALFFGLGEMLSIPVQPGPPKLHPEGDVAQFGAQRIAPGLWSLSPSVNLPDLIHFFAVLHGVPDPAPWEQRIILPGGAI